MPLLAQSHLPDEQLHLACSSLTGCTSDKSHQAPLALPPSCLPSPWSCIRLWISQGFLAFCLWPLKDIKAFCIVTGERKLFQSVKAEESFFMSADSYLRSWFQELASREPQMPGDSWRR